MIIVKPKVFMGADRSLAFYQELRKQQENGLILIPIWCEVIVVDDETGIVFETEEESDD